MKKCPPGLVAFVEVWLGTSVCTAFAILHIGQGSKGVLVFTCRLQCLAVLLMVSWAQWLNNLWRKLMSWALLDCKHRLAISSFAIMSTPPRKPSFVAKILTKVIEVSPFFRVITDPTLEMSQRDVKGKSRENKFTQSPGTCLKGDKKMSIIVPSFCTTVTLFLPTLVLVSILPYPVCMEHFSSFTSNIPASHPPIWELQAESARNVLGFNL